MNNYNNFKSIAQHFSSVSPGRGELITPKHINNAASAITEEFRVLTNNHKIEPEKIWSFFCFEAGVKAKAPRRITKRAVSKVIKKSVNKACFDYDQTHCFDKDFLYTSKRFVKQYKLLNGYSIHNRYLFSIAESKRFYATASRHKAESVGLASLSLKDGLKPVKATLTLKSEYHLSSPAWCGVTANESAKYLTNALSDLYQLARNNKLRLTYIRSIEVHENGAPHVEGLFFTDNVEKFNELLLKAIGKNPQLGNFKAEEAENVYACINYVLKEEWPSDDEDHERRRLWKKSLSSRCFAKSSNVIKLPPVALWDAYRKGRFNAINEINAVNNLEDKLYTTEYDHLSGESYVQLSDYSRHTDHDDAFDSVTSRLTSAVRDGDYAEFTRVFTVATNSRKRSIFKKTMGLETTGSFGNREIYEITKLTTIRQVVSKFGEKIRDIEDMKYILRTKKWHGISKEYRKRRWEADKFMENFRKSQDAGYQLALI